MANECVFSANENGKERKERKKERKKGRKRREGGNGLIIYYSRRAGESVTRTPLVES